MICKKQVFLLLLGFGMVTSWEHSSHAQSVIAAPDGVGTSITPNGNRLDISGGTQAGSNLFHSFQRFDLSPDQVANFLSNSTIQTILARVVGGEPSMLHGLIRVSGGASNLFLLNPAGIVFGSTARLDVPAAFTATTATGIQFDTGWAGLKTSAEQLQTLGGSPQGLAFTTVQPGAIFNAATLEVPVGQHLGLIGGVVVNTGNLLAPGGTLTLAAVPGEQVVRIQPSGQVLSFELPQAGIWATTLDGLGQALPPVPLAQLLTGGRAGNATGVTVAEGVVRLTGSGVPLPDTAGTAIAAGSLSTASPIAATPQIDVLGQTVGVLGAAIDASAPNGGGTIRIGGDYQGQGVLPRATMTAVTADSTIRANALQHGNGGTVVVWADNTTRFSGAIQARGGIDGGHGGRVETSGKQTLDIAGGQVDASARLGQPGTWLLDPTNIAIAIGGIGILSEGVFDPSTTGVQSRISPTMIEMALNSGTSVTITTASGTGGEGDITLINPINQIGGGTASLTLIGRQFQRTGSATINLSSTGGLNLYLNHVNPEAIAPSSSIQNAIDAIGAVAGSRTIYLGTGTYTGATITINQSVSLQGVGATSTILQGNGNSRVIEVGPGVVATLENVRVTGGQTTQSGGGISNAGTLTITNSTILQNQAGLNGGAIENFGAQSVLALINTTLSNNTAAIDGGAVFNSGRLTLLNSTIANNQASNNGGGVYNEGNLSIRNSTLSSNQALQQGGGLLHASSQPAVITHSTITANQANAQGGGISSQGTTQLSNTIVAANTSPTAADVIGSFLDGGNNLIGTGTGSNGLTLSQLVGTDTARINPRLGPLANNGGATPTHALLLDSPAINRGNNAGAPTTDQRGLTRIMNGVIDIGAFEVQTAAQPITPQPRPTSSPSGTVARGAAGLTISPSTPGLAAENSVHGSAFTTDLRNPASNPNGLSTVIEQPAAQSVEAAVAVVDRSFSQAYEHYLSLPPPQALTIQSLQSRLRQVQQQRQAATAVIYAVFDPSAVSSGPVASSLRASLGSDRDFLHLILITPTGRPIHKVIPVQRDVILEQAKLFRLATSDPEDNQGFQALAHQLYGWLLHPLDAELRQQGITHLIYCMDEGLRTIPLAAMMDEHRFITHRYAISTIPSVGLTNFDVTPPNLNAVMAMGADRFQSQEALPAVPMELSAISQEWPQSAVLLNEQFTLNKLLETLRSTQFPVLHLATHAEFKEGKPQQSYIQLWDRPLTLAQMRSLNWRDLNLTLLTLSACTTAVSSREAELGFAGLAAVSGVRSSMGSLWTVSDIGTLAFMSEFYTQLATNPSVSTALQKTQLALIGGKVYLDHGVLVTSQHRIVLPNPSHLPAQATFDHPFYWSAFTLVGNPW